VELTPEEGRVIGSLVEKQLTTPQQYPLTLNSLLLACNQSSNRDPVVNYEEGQVERALRSLKDAGLVRFVYPSHGRSVTRYEQLLPERLALTDEQVSLLAVLLLRGPQTSGELRGRTERMARFDGIGGVEDELRRMTELPDPLVVRLGRRPGQKEERWAQLVTGAVTDTQDSWVAPAGVSTRGSRGSLADEVAQLREEVREVREELASLRARIEAWES
jgi:uncharacterized protein